VPDLKSKVPDFGVKVPDPKLEVPDLRSGGIRLNLTPGWVSCRLLKACCRNPKDVLSCIHVARTYYTDYDKHSAHVLNVITK